jgi:hypothetical protein
MQENLNDYVHDQITGLGAKTVPSIQMGCYEFKGFYAPHLDTLHPNYTTKHRRLGDRIATLLLYVRTFRIASHKKFQLKTFAHNWIFPRLQLLIVISDFLSLRIYLLIFIF